MRQYINMNDSRSACGRDMTNEMDPNKYSNAYSGMNNENENEKIRAKSLLGQEAIMLLRLCG